MHANELDNLTVLHRLKDSAGHGAAADVAQQLTDASFPVDTCLRQLWVFGAAGAVPAVAHDNSIEYFSGGEAYSFLLQTMTGLNSSVPGETNVQGQFKCGWKRWQQAAPPQRAHTINGLMQRLLEDAQTIRSDHLQNIGGNSYGSLARKLLKLPASAQVLFVGSGKFATSMLPFFSDWQTGLWNHRLHPGLQPPDAARVFQPHDQQRAAAWATDIVLTTPADETHDRGWLELALDHDIERVLHLGRRQAEPGVWATRSAQLNYASLDDIFSLRQHQSTLRDLSVIRARVACERLAAASTTSAAVHALPLRA